MIKQEHIELARDLMDWVAQREYERDRSGAKFKHIVELHRFACHAIRGEQGLAIYRAHEWNQEDQWLKNDILGPSDQGFRKAIHLKKLRRRAGGDPMTRIQTVHKLRSDLGVIARESRLVWDRLAVYELLPGIDGREHSCITYESHAKIDTRQTHLHQLVLHARESIKEASGGYIWTSIWEDFK